MIYLQMSKYYFLDLTGLIISSSDELMKCYHIDDGAHLNSVEY
jgi:hypothetical protein